jgi:hypothetical protein
MSSGDGGTTPAVLYVMGAGRSGSTVLGQALGQLEGIAQAGELASLWHRGLINNEPCGCGLPTRECPFWSEAARRTFDGTRWTPEDVAHWHAQVNRVRYLRRNLRSVPGRSGWEPLDRSAEVYSRLYPALAAIGGGVVLDSFKSPSFAAFVAGVPGVRSYFVPSPGAA